MKLKSREVLLLVFSVFSGALLTGILTATPASAYADPDRTEHRTVSGYPLYPDWIFNKPDHYEFSPLVSNSDPLTQHPDQWDGQDWDPSKWGPGWTPEIALQKFFSARVFEKQYIDKGFMSGTEMPVVELGPTFYKLSDLDQRRTLKLLSDQMGYFQSGYSSVKLIDWYTHDIIGTYTAKGMFLN